MQFKSYLKHWFHHKFLHLSEKMKKVTYAYKTSDKCTCTSTLHTTEGQIFMLCVCVANVHLAFCTVLSVPFAQN